MMRFFILAAVLFAVPANAVGQILQLAELSVRDLEQLNHEQTVVIIPGGIFEQHGPYLPSFTDGYLNEWLAAQTAEATLAARGGTVLMFPTIPLGAGLPEDFAGLSPFSRSYTVRPETLRAIYMDLASALGQDGFRTVFLLNRHGAPAHNWALLEAADYFNDRFDGTMVVLTSLLYDGTIEAPSFLDSEEKIEHGIDIHAGVGETSQTLFLQPRLVHDDYRLARPMTADSAEDLTRIAESTGWPGYFGSPRLATQAADAQVVEYRTKQVVELALRILDGFDWRVLPTCADITNASFRAVDDNNRARAEEEKRRQEEWIAGRPRQDSSR